MGEYPLTLQQRYLNHTRLRYARGWEPLTLTRYSDLSQYTDPSECIVFWSDMISRAANSLDNWTTSSHLANLHKHLILSLHSHPNKCFGTLHNHRKTPSNSKHPQTRPAFHSHHYSITHFIDLGICTEFCYGLCYRTGKSLNHKIKTLQIKSHKHDQLS